MNTTNDLVLRSYGYRENCGCPDCVAQRTPRWPCGRPRREWDMPVPMPTVRYEQGIADVARGIGPTQLCN